MSLFRPLYVTAFLLDDWLASTSYFGATRVLVTSASAKTAFSLATLLSKRGSGRPKIVGLTSAKNRPFVEGLGVYDEVRLYDDVATLPIERTVSIDVAGNEKVLGAIHERLVSELAHSCRLGGSHWESRPDLAGGGANWPGPAPQLFFAPSHAEQLMKEWTPPVFIERVGASLARFLQETRGGWLEVRESRGREAVDTLYHQMLDAQVPPNIGVMLALGE